MWWMAERDHRASGPQSLGYQTSTPPAARAARRCSCTSRTAGASASASHTYGSSPGNTATRLTDDVLRNVNAWKAEVS